MPMYERLGVHVLDPNGYTVPTNIRLEGGSHLKIEGGNRWNSIRIKFSAGDDKGWWVGRESLRQLITELLYIKGEIDEHFEKAEDLGPVIERVKDDEVIDDGDPPF